MDPSRLSPEGRLKDEDIEIRIPDQTEYCLHLLRGRGLVARLRPVLDSVAQDVVLGLDHHTEC